jgi:hypothetical protein
VADSPNALSAVLFPLFRLFLSDMRRPKPPRHFLNLLGSIIFTTRKLVAKLPSVDSAVERGAGIGRETVSGRLVSNATVTDFELLASDDRTHREGFPDRNSP